MRISGFGLAAAMIGMTLGICGPAPAQETGGAASKAAAAAPASPQGAETAQSPGVAPGEFADDTTIQQRLQEIVELAKKSTEDAHRYDITTLTCAQFLELSASQDPNDYAVMAMLMVWVHGYHNGLRGINFHAYPLDTQGIVSLTTQMVSICKDHPKELFHVAAAHLD